MKSKVQFLKQSANTVISAPPQEFFSDTITIGRATSQDIFLADPTIALEHARIRIKGADQIYLETVNTVGIDINGHIETRARLKPWDKITLGPFLITVVQPTAGFVLSLLVEQTKAVKDKTRISHGKTQMISPGKKTPAGAKKAATTDKTPAAAAAPAAEPEEKQVQRLAMDLTQTALSKRRWAWWAVLGILTVFLLSPLATLLGSAGGALATLLPDDTLWNTGKISHVHQHFGQQCRICHSAPFTMVENETCIECHTGTKAHTEMDHMPTSMTLLENGRCGRCHKEHNETLSLKPSHQSLCVDCHGDLNKHGDLPSNLTDVTDFGTDHPEFRPTILREDEWWRIALGDPELKHDGGLKFSHAGHLKPEGVDGLNGKKTVLECADCHQPEPGGAYMLPIEMERDCQSCHQLNFDPALPERTVPHGDLPQLLTFLNEFYALQALQGGYESADAPTTVKRRRRPDERVSGREQQDALRWAKTKAETMVREVIEARICATCHIVTAEANSAFGWVINPIYQPTRWLTLSRFNHAKHDTRPCGDCHAAVKSEVADDVLLPGVEDCRECHGGAKSRDKYASSCTVCHQFHLDDMPPYGQHTANSGEKAE
jgi:predicted CXXCH cytochrome family protein